MLQGLENFVYSYKLSWANIPQYLGKALAIIEWNWFIEPIVLVSLQLVKAVDCANMDFSIWITADPQLNVSIFSGVFIFNALISTPYFLMMNRIIEKLIERWDF